VTAVSTIEGKDRRDRKGLMRKPSAGPFTPSCARWQPPSISMICLLSKRSPNRARKDPFEVLISTMLSAQTRESGHRRGVRAAVPGRAHAPDDGEADDDTDREADLPVSFYRHKAKHVQETCRLLVTVIAVACRGRWRSC
jgi:endonuclease III